MTRRDDTGGTPAAQQGIGIMAGTPKKANIDGTGGATANFSGEWDNGDLTGTTTAANNGAGFNDADWAGAAAG